MDEITFTVPGQPVPQPRHKVTARGRFARAYIEARHPIHAYRQAIALSAQVAGGRPVDGPVELEVEFVFERPPSHWTKTGLSKGAPQIPPRCDWDNLGKAVSDAITDSAAIWLDDDQVVDGRCRKRYAERGEAPRTVVRVRRLA
jgi:Holliday junction resolvase RusA-like endonuclease